MQIRESAEDYLEAILVLSKGGGVRSVDIASMLGVSKPSVSHAMKLLREDGYIAMDRYGTVTLMDKGSEIAHRIYERHTVLTKMLEDLVFHRRLQGQMPARWSMMSATRASRRSRSI